MTTSNKLTYIDLFAGCGGLSLGLYKSGYWHGLFAVEKSPDAFKTLKHNLIKQHGHFSWPKWLGEPKSHDINELLAEHENELKTLCGKVDLIVGGPPCQGFSLAGRRKEGDQRNTLLHSYLKFVKLIQPKVILFENVKGFNIGFKKEDETRGIPYSKIVKHELEQLGYQVDAKLLNFSHYGVPQARERFIIVATKKGIHNSFFNDLERVADDFKTDKGIKQTVSIKQAISDLEAKHGTLISSDNNRFKAGTYGKRPTRFQSLMRVDKKNKVPDSHRFANHTERIRERFSIIINEQLTSSEIQQRFKTRKTSTKLLEQSKPAPTLTTLPDDYVHYCEPRILTVREYARIQSFPDWYEFKGKYTTGGPRRKIEVPRYSQIGNAIPPLFGELAGLVLGEIIDA